jgi:hypothetical protein
MTKKRKPNALLHDLGLDEALARFIQTDKREVEDVIDRVIREEQAVSDYVEERRDSIRKGARRTGTRFRI